MNSKDSITSVVATLDKEFTQYYSVNSTQKRRGDDLLNSIAEQVIDCKRKYAVVNKQEPDVIIFFRDGIGSGSFDQVREKEIAEILRQLKEGSSDKNKVPKLCYIVVNKRVNDRFFELNKQSRQLQNPNGGLIIKSTVTNSTGFDYFMVSQNVNRGTATPTHYECLFNNTGLTADTIYELTYYQTFNYYNWPGPVKVPAVIQYATKQGYLVGSTKMKTKEAGTSEDLES
jgi:aubergine